MPDFRKLYNDFFYIPKHEKLSDRVFRCRIATSVLTIFACVTVMTASTFALFSSQVSTGSFTIASAHFAVTVNEVAYDDEAYICPLAFEDTHIFKIEPAGTASTGYCEIVIGDDTYYTPQITTGSAFTLTVTAAEGTPIAFNPCWGSSPVAMFSEGVSENTAEIFHSTTPYAVYVVEEGATLEGIAEYYGVEEEDILIYNNLSEIPAGFALGFALKIPGVDPDEIEPYKVPAEEEAAAEEEQTEAQSKESSEESGEESLGSNSESASGDDTAETDGNASDSESGGESSGESSESTADENTTGTDGNVSDGESGGESSGDSSESAADENTTETDSNASGGESGAESSGDSSEASGGGESSAEPAAVSEASAEASSETSSEASTDSASSDSGGESSAGDSTSSGGGDNSSADSGSSGSETGE